MFVGRAGGYGGRGLAGWVVLRVSVFDVANGAK